MSEATTLDGYDDRADAYAAADDLAATLRALQKTKRFGVRVVRRGGAWQVQVVDRSAGLDDAPVTHEAHCRPAGTSPDLALPGSLSCQTAGRR